MSNVIDITGILQERREQREFDKAFDAYLDLLDVIEEHGDGFFENQEKIEFSIEDALNDWFSRK
ncbi:MAG: hypothetical protein AB7M93_30725 [Candidatus Obscuribacterales bacterium]